MRLGIIKIQGKLILLPQMPLLNLQVKAVIGNGLQVEFDAYTDQLEQVYFFGQCSEICGANHSFMPIVLEIVNSKTFLN